MSSRPIRYALIAGEARPEIMAVLDHARIPYAVFRPEALPDPLDVSGALIAADGACLRLGTNVATWMGALLASGGGAVWLDGMLPGSPETLARLFSVIARPMEGFEALGLSRNLSRDFLGGGFELTEAFALLKAIPACRLEAAPQCRTLLLADGRPAWVAGPHGKGRLVLGGVSPSLWKREILGPASGLDDLLWRSLAWAARIDDVIGEKGLAYVDTLNACGLAPNLGMDVDHVHPEALPLLGDLGRAGKAQLSPHAFTSYRVVPTEQTELIYMDWEKGDYADERVANSFARVDAFFDKLGVPQANTLNYHYCTIGSNVAQHLHKRGVRHLTFPFLPGETLQTQLHRIWNPKPYGRLGYCLDWLPDLSFFVMCSFPLGDLSTEQLDSGWYTCDVRLTSDMDFFFGSNLREEVFRDHDLVAAKLDRQLRRSLGSLFFGHVFTHEPYIIKVTEEDFSQVLNAGLKGVNSSGYPLVFSNLDDIGEYAQRWLRVRLRGASLDGDGRTVRLELGGKISSPLWYWRFDEDRTDVVTQLVRCS